MNGKRMARAGLATVAGAAELFRGVQKKQRELNSSADDWAVFRSYCEEVLASDSVQAQSRAPSQTSQVLNDVWQYVQRAGDAAEAPNFGTLLQGVVRAVWTGADIC